MKSEFDARIDVTVQSNLIKYYMFMILGSLQSKYTYKNGE